jgi:hypothetical protein
MATSQERPEFVADPLHLPVYKGFRHYHMVVLSTIGLLSASYFVERDLVNPNIANHKVLGQFVCEYVRSHPDSTYRDIQSAVIQATRQNNIPRITSNPIIGKTIGVSTFETMISDAINLRDLDRKKMRKFTIPDCLKTLTFDLNSTHTSRLYASQMLSFSLFVIGCAGWVTGLKRRQKTMRD